MKEMSHGIESNVHLRASLPRESDHFKKRIKWPVNFNINPFSDKKPFLVASPKTRKGAKLAETSCTLLLATCIPCLKNNGKDSKTPRQAGRGVVRAGNYFTRLFGH
jgi:hypothetical protein